METLSFDRFANLEKYIFSEVNNNFHSRGFLTPKDFFCIVIWKSNRAKGRIKQRLAREGTLEKVVKQLTKEVFTERDDKNKLRLLVEKWGFRLPMASAILTVLYPKDFTVYDYRVLKQVELNDFSDRKNQVEKYFSDFLPRVKRIGKGRTLRDKDKYLWGKSFYTDLKNFLKHKSNKPMQKQKEIY